LGYSNTEVKFQFSAKLKAIEIKERFDLWIAYTQLSFFQLYNKSKSAPFRESNYEPEIMGVVHTDYDLFGLKGRFINIGLVHQSNGLRSHCREAGIGFTHNSDSSEERSD
jgi:phospholipase A1